MAAPTLDIIGIGNAIMDVLAPVEDAFLRDRDLAKGSMRLIDAATAEALHAAMPGAVETSGGSAANTCAAAAALGARVGYLGKVAEDRLGEAFSRDMRAIGVRYATPPLRGGAPTARSLILVTPDAQRTMNTFLGASVHFAPEDVRDAEIAEAGILYLEGYLFDPPAAQAAFRKAASAAHASGRQVALTLSDPFCVDRHRAAFRAFVATETDILFANRAELCSLYETTDLAEAVRLARGEVRLAAITLGAEGSLVVSGSGTEAIAAEPVTVVDTTGAGDAYAAGFLAALAGGHAPAVCGRWGSLAAAEAISHFGARPQADLRAIVATRARQ